MKLNYSVFEQIKPGLSSLIKIGDVDDVLEESPSKLADSLILFCQVCRLIEPIYILLILSLFCCIIYIIIHSFLIKGLGLFPTVRRRSLQASDSCLGNNAKMRNRFYYILQTLSYSINYEILCRRMSMEQYDIPNIRRLSISSPLH